MLFLISRAVWFSESLEKTGVFEPLFTNLVKAGEAGGVLDESLERVADFYEGWLSFRIR